MFLVVNLSREVPDAETAQELVNIVADRLSDHPEVKIDAHVSEHLEIPVPPT